MKRTNFCRGFYGAVLVLLAWLPSARALAQAVVVLPYVQPGDGRTLDGTDVKVIHWLTDQTPAEFIVEFEQPDHDVQTVKPSRIALDFTPRKIPKKETARKTKKQKEAGKKETEKETNEDQEAAPAEKNQRFFKYSANLKDLPFNADIRYRVKLGEEVIREATFRTRATAEKPARCVLVGDMAQGWLAQREVAYRISQHSPDFLVALGDIVYPTGRANQYMSYFWGTYNNVNKAGPRAGAPLMASVPFYPVLGNHDIGASLAHTPDALAVYHFFSPPRGGPGEGPWVTPLEGNKEDVARFRKATKDSYPNLDAYSFDYGAAHFVVLNNNRGLGIDAPAFRAWLLDDLKASKAAWKFVCFHVPGFHSSKHHYPEQQMRRLQPLFEEGGVDITFAGHVHNYQRSVPLKFVPDSNQPKKGGLVNGEFTLDYHFDGACHTQPVGVIHIVAGGGGAGLYGPGLDKTAADLRKAHGANYADYTASMVADQHSFVVLDIAPQRLDLRAIGAKGNELDRMTITRGTTWNPPFNPGRQRSFPRFRLRRWR